MKLPPLRVLLLCLCSGILSGLIIPLFPNSSNVTFILPGIFYGLFFLIRLPAKKKSSMLKRCGVVLASATACFAAIKLAIEIISSPGKPDWLGYFAAGMLGATLLHLTLAFAGNVRLSLKKLSLSALGGALLGLIFSLPIHTDSDLTGAFLFSGYYAFWQLGMGVVLYRQALEKNAT